MAEGFCLFYTLQVDIHTLIFFLANLAKGNMSFCHHLFFIPISILQASSSFIIIKIIITFLEQTIKLRYFHVYLNFSTIKFLLYFSFNFIGNLYIFLYKQSITIRFGLKFDTKNKNDARGSGSADGKGSGSYDAFAKGQADGFAKGQADAYAKGQADAYAKGYADAMAKGNVNNTNTNNR
jgi:hypothetical protein